MSSPFWGAASRFLLSALIFAVIALALRVRMPRGRALIGAVVYGTLQFGGGFGFVYWGLVHAPAGLAQVLLASVPLLTFALALAHRQERFRRDRLVGAVGRRRHRHGLQQRDPRRRPAHVDGGYLCGRDVLRRR